MSWVIHHIRVIRRWHAKIGVAAMFYLVFLVVSGWALNHTEGLRLDEREVTAPWLMRWYGIQAETPVLGYALGTTYLAWSGEKWALGSRQLLISAGVPVGAIDVEGIYYIATARTLYLFQKDGQLVDKLDAASLPETPIITLGSAGNKIVLKTLTKAFYTIDGLSWQPIAEKGVKWSSVQSLPDDVKKQLAVTLAPGLSLQRIMLDIHSGRIFGRFGIYIVDFLGLALLTLGTSGLWIYWRSVRQGRKRKP